MGSYILEVLMFWFFEYIPDQKLGTKYPSSVGICSFHQENRGEEDYVGWFFLLKAGEFSCTAATWLLTAERLYGNQI